MMSLGVLLCLASAKDAVVRRTASMVVEVDSAAQAEQELPRLKTPCGEGNQAESECITECLDDADCLKQPLVLAAIGASEVLTLEQMSNSDNFEFGTGSPCASFYGDDALSAIGGFVRSMGSTSQTFCSRHTEESELTPRGQHDAAECKDGLCVAHNHASDECTGNAWKQPKYCKYKSRSCGSKAECFVKCMQDDDCREKAKEQKDGALEKALLGALGLYCSEEAAEGLEGRKCFFAPERPCSDTCQDGFDCNDGMCAAAAPVQPELRPVQEKPSIGARMKDKWDDWWGDDEDAESGSSKKWWHFGRGSK